MTDMKRYAFYLLIVAAAAMAACQKPAVIEEPENQPQEQPAAESETPEVEVGTYTYTIDASMEPEGKSDYDAGGHFTWSAGDAISVLFHNGDDNQFFTLTTEGTGATATFSGEITAGYEIGASDGDALDKKIWVLFPASANHTYTVGENPTFHIPSVTDYTAPGAHYSANLPMYDLLTDEGSIVFKHLACAYKFVFTNLDPSVTKVQFTVSNQKTYALSGNVTIRDGYYLDHGYSSPGSAERALTFISNVADNKAVFYVPCRYYADCFQPIISLVDYSTGNTLIEKTATKSTAIDSKGKVQPVNINAPGTGTPWEFPSAYSIDWNGFGIASAAGDTGDGYDGIVSMKATANETNLYLLLQVKKEALYDNAGYKYANYSHLYIGDGSGETAFWAWPTPYLHDFTSWFKYNNAPRYINWNTGFVGQKAVEYLGCFYYEVAIARSSYTALQGASATLCLMINQQYVHIVDEVEKWAGTETQIGFVPARWSAGLTVELP